MGRGDQFSYEGLNILFNGLEQYEADTGEGVELDVIALCCDFSEESEEEIKENYSYMIKEGEDLEQFLSDNTWVLGSHEEDGKKYFIYQQF
jgi:hypothetical protein